MNIVGTLLVRDEADIIAANIEHQLSQGVQAIVLTNNGSIDATREIATSYKQVVKIFDEPELTYHQMTWVTRMAHWINENLKADWIFHCDADEFWYGLDFLKQVPENIFMVKSCSSIHPQQGDGTTCKNFVPVEDLQDSIFEPEKMLYYHWSTGDRVMRGCKIVHRPDSKIQIRQGNHDAWIDGRKQICTKQITINHYPVRSYAHFERKVINGGSAYRASGLSIDQGHHWRRWYDAWETGNLREHYEDLLYTPDKIKAGLDSGFLMTTKSRWML